MKLIHNLGGGGFGTVDLVEDETGARFARKTFHFAAPGAPQLEKNVLQRFRKEAKTQMGLDHRNIVPVLSEELTATPPFYLMPAADGSLDKDIEGDKQLGGGWINAIGDIVAGLEEIHRLGIFHRDLKPQNVLRFHDFNYTYYAIGDFGLISQKDSQLSTLTTSGMKKGSDSYTAPEITNDLRRASIQSDVYSLGCVIHDMVGLADRIPCHEIRETGPYAGVLLGCTRTDRKRRFKSAKAVLDALIAIEPTFAPAAGDKAATFISSLESPNALDAQFWQGIGEFLQYEANDNDRAAVCWKLTLDRISEACTADIAAASQIASVFAEWASSHSFAFESCDGIANRLCRFFEDVQLEAKVESLLALLRMGTSHNRWYVEGLFFGRCGPGLATDVADRLAVEFRVNDDQVCVDIAHLEASISVSRESLHPKLVQTLEDICK